MMYKVRCSDHSELKNPYSRMVLEKLEAVVDKIQDKNFTLIHKSKHDDFGAIVYSFIRKDLLTPKQRYLEKKKELI